MQGNPIQSFADRGGAVDLGHLVSEHCMPQPGMLQQGMLQQGRGDATARWPAVARMGSLRTGGSGFSIWIQLRGQTRVAAREGSFTLRPGEWLALDRDSAPELLAGRSGATLGVLLPADPGGGRRGELLPGRGCMSLRDLRIAIRLWRNGRDAAAGAATGERARADYGNSNGNSDAAARALPSMLAHLCTLQRELDGGISRSPGRSVRRKRQVFGRLQRARLFLDGHRNRVVRLNELAELTSFSSWYLSKTFHEIYEESPQAASVRLRLEHACDLLSSSDYSISEIGAACGFDNSCSFARAFRARFFSTATAYRETARETAREAARTRAKVGTGTKPSTQSVYATRNVMWSGL